MTTKNKNPYYQPCVDAYFEFYESKFNRKPLPSASEFAMLKSIIVNIQQLTLQANMPITEELMVASFQKFLGLAYSDKWLAEHFSIGIMLKQFDIIISKSNKTPSTNLNTDDYAMSYNAWEQLRNNQ